MGNAISKVKKHNRNKNQRLKNKTLFNNDDDETIDRLQVLHHFYRHQWEGNFNAPIKEMLKNGGLMVLDVGSGAGTWTCDMSTDFPLNLYFGVEMLSIFPHEKPRNIVFLLNDILEGLPFRSNSFDYIHLRFMSLSLKSDVWQDKVINELARVLRPGGYLEIMENEITVSNRGPNVQEFFDRGKMLIALYFLFVKFSSLFFFLFFFILLKK
jgi:ubiquinone/menaquinone biosynthesis C-methylase UbiE